ncbi:MAG: hypothetical protein ACKO96_05125 [Flammeovirgaceae bacterium]
MVTANEEIVQLIQSGRMTPQQAEAIFSQAGVNVAAGGGARTRYLQANPQIDQLVRSLVNGQGAGAMPLGVEPLHQYERTALRLLGEGANNPNATAQSDLSRQYMEMIRPYLGKADEQLQRSTAPITSQEIESLFNPFQEQVLNRSVARLTDQRNNRLDELNRQQGRRGAASFGDLAYGRQMGDVEKGFADATADTTASLNMQGWQQSLADVFKTRQLQQNAATGYSNMGNVASGASGQAQQNASGSLADTLKILSGQLGAGGQIRQFNQGLADMTYNDMQGQANYPRTNLQSVLSMLPMFQSNTATNSTPIQSRWQAFNEAFSGIGGGITSLFGNTNKNKK